MSATPWVTLAHILRPQGRRGEVIADLLTDFPEKFAERKRLFLLTQKEIPAPNTAPDTNPDPRPVQLEDFRLMPGRVVLKFAEIDSINEAETLRGLSVVIPAEERAPLDADSVYIDDLIGCSVFDLAPADGPILIGSITHVDRLGSNTDLLVVRRDDNPALTAEIPFVKAMLVRLDIPGRCIEMRLPAGLIDVNTPTKSAPSKSPRTKPPRPKTHPTKSKPAKS